MPGAWETKSPEVLVAVLSSRTVPFKWALALRNLRLPGSANIIALSGMPFDHARNAAVEHMIKKGFTRLMFIDDDVILPADSYERLAAHGQDIVSGLYYRRTPPIQPVAMRWQDGKSVYIGGFKAGEMVEVDLVGAGCLLIHRRVFETMPEPWFEWWIDRKDLPENQRLSEDFSFCKKAQGHGFRIYVDTFVQCLHAGYGRSEIGGHFKPLEI